MKVYPLSEGIFYIGKEKKMISEKDPIVSNLQLSQYLKLAICPFLIDINNEWILLDTGLGKTKNLIFHVNIFDNLKKHSVQPEDISKVFISHFHSDHYGGIIKDNNISFPNAMYFFNKKDWDEHRKHSFLKHFNLEEKQLDTLFADNKILVEDSYEAANISIETCGGHTQNHMSIILKEGEEIAFYAGDIAPQLAQLQKKMKAKYDFNPDVSANLRKQWWLKANQEKWLFLFYHDINYRSYKIE